MGHQLQLTAQLSFVWATKSQTTTNVGLVFIDINVFTWFRTSLGLLSIYKLILQVVYWLGNASRMQLFIVQIPNRALFVLNYKVKHEVICLYFSFIFLY